MSSYTLSAFAFFNPLPSVTAQDLSNMRSSYYSDLYDTLPNLPMDTPSLSKGLARLMSSYMLSLYAVFVPLPSLTAQDMANMRSTYYSEIHNSLPDFCPASATGYTLAQSLGRLMSNYLLSIYAFFVHLPSLTASDLAGMRSTNYTEICCAVQRIFVSVCSTVYNIFAQPQSPQAILPWVPKPIKYTLLLLLIINCRSFPFNWHSMLPLFIFKRS